MTISPRVLLCEAWCSITEIHDSTTLSTLMSSAALAITDRTASTSHTTACCQGAEITPAAPCRTTLCWQALWKGFQAFSDTLCTAISAPACQPSAVTMCPLQLH
jgi:hypothetical protein